MADSETTRARRGRVRRIIARLEEAHGDTRFALDFDGPFELLVALLLAAQCTDAKVNEVTPGLFARYPDPAAFAAVPQAELERAIHATGFFRQKARTLRACAQALLERHGGCVPDDLDALLALPGVGRKTANILRGNAFGRPGIGVDTHVGRLAQRLGLSAQRDPDKIERDLVAVVPAAQQSRFCTLLQAHGRTTCKARTPLCYDCAVRRLCPYEPKTPAPEKPPTPRRSRWVGRPKTRAGRR